MKKKFSLNGHFSFGYFMTPMTLFRMTNSGTTTLPHVWLLSELELRLKNQRVARHETKPLPPEFKVLGQPVT